MNNKGQVLVVFVIILPIFLLILTFVVDYGLLSIEKRKIDNNTYDAIKYYIDNIDDDNVLEKTKDLLNKNLDNIEISIIENNNSVEINVKSNYKSLYNSITNSDLIVKYRGLKESKEIIKG